jgi:8-amino-7-oxononanoate synthase
MELNTGSSSSQIIPIIVGHEKDALKLYNNLLKRRIFASTIRPPTVPPNTSRIRFTISSSHTEEEIEHLIKTIKDCI